jgi:cellobiose phosphorylase
MKFGYFDDTNREYVITTPTTPLPWINYLGCNDFFSLISNTCGGYSFYKDAKLLRLTRYRYNDVPADINGKYFYIREGETVWNPGWQPVKTRLDSYECRHGMGYSRFTSSKNQVEASVLTFVPMRDACEISQLKLTNSSPSFPTWNGACGMRMTTAEISSAITARERWRWQALRFSTKQSTGSGAIIMRSIP